MLVSVLFGAFVGGHFDALGCTLAAWLEEDGGCSTWLMLSGALNANTVK